VSGNSEIIARVEWGSTWADFGANLAWSGPGAQEAGRAAFVANGHRPYIDPMWSHEEPEAAAEALGGVCHVIKRIRRWE
jgi:hypothetical protein